MRVGNAAVMTGECERSDRFLNGLATGVQSPPRQEQTIGDLYEASLEAIQTVPAYAKLAVRFACTEEVPNLSYQTQKWFKNHQGLVAQDPLREELGYPESFTPQKWLEFISDKLSNSGSPEYKTLKRGLSGPLKTNRWQRAKALAYIIAEQELASPYIHNDGPPVVHEYGASAGLILRALATRTMNETVIVDYNDSVDAVETAKFDIKTRMSTLGRGIGVDISPPRSSDEREQIKYMTLNPSEYDRQDAQANYEETFDRLMMSPDPRVSMITGDVLALPKSANNKLMRDKANVALFSHMLEAHPQRIRSIVETVLPFMQADGVILINGYLKVHPHDPQKLIVEEDWYSEPWKCRTIGLSVRKMEAGFFTMIEWHDGHYDVGRFPGASKES